MAEFKTTEVSANPEGTDRDVIRTDDDGVATLTLNRPGARNALSTGLMTSLKAALDEVGRDASIRVVIIAANGPAFCAGHDLKEIQASGDRGFYDRLFRQCSDLMLTITRLPKPVIARVHAMATAAGCQLVATCDLAVAASSARFATPGVNIGLFCSTPMVALSRAIGRKAALEMLLTGEAIDADAAARLGLVNRVVDHDDLETETLSLARRIADKSPVTVSIGKEAFYQQADLDLEDAYDYAGGVMVRNMMTADAAEGISAFIEKRHPKWSSE